MPVHTAQESPLHLTSERKALLINLDQGIYGTFAEIGAGQEVARHFFTAGGAAGTIAKSMSAYDMKFSDEIYGKAQRYVSRERLIQMLDHEYALLTERLEKERGNASTFFVFAHTVSAASYHNNKNCHGWMGVRFQITPNSEPNDIILHVRMWDKTPVLQQESIGIFGVNFLWAAFVYFNDLDQFINGLVDQLGIHRIEVDMLKFSGPNLNHIENHLVSLKLVENRLTNAVMFGPNSNIIQPSEALYKKCILVERGSFKPLTHVHLDMMECSHNNFKKEPKVKAESIEHIIEITINNLRGDDNKIDYEDFLARIHCISALGYSVLVSNYTRYYRLSAYFRRYTDQLIGMAMGINHIQAIFDEQFYENLDGGILEAVGRLFKQDVKLYVYPMRLKALKMHEQTSEDIIDKHAYDEDAIITADHLEIEHHLRHLYAYLLERNSIKPLPGANKDYLNIHARDVRKLMAANDESWKNFVPKPVADVIQKEKLWGVKG